jgi:hypothetical protein
MRNVPPVLVPMGQLYDPLIGLASRIHRGLGTKQKTVWTDDRGGVFMDHVARLGSKSPSAIVGTYDTDTPMCVIECDLRVTLRERASTWITDWNAPQPRIPRVERLPGARSPVRARPKRVRAAIAWV